MDDSALIQKFCQNGDRDAARELLERYERPLFNYLWQMLRHTQDSEDALQECFGKVLRALPRYREENHFKSWLYRIAHNEGLNTIRRRKRFVVDPDPTELAEDPLTSSPIDAPNEIDGQERAELLQNAVGQLPDHEREVILLRLQADLPFKEIARITDSPIGTVLARMHNAKKRLKKILSPELAMES
ncbi:MAG: RNA polymerase sigma factor [Verrucomicrobiota bacterium]